MDVSCSEGGGAPVVRQHRERGPQVPLPAWSFGSTGTPGPLPRDSGLRGD